MIVSYSEYYSIAPFTENGLLRLVWPEHVCYTISAYMACARHLVVSPKGTSIVFICLSCWFGWLMFTVLNQTQALSNWNCSLLGLIKYSMNCSLILLK